MTDKDDDKDIDKDIDKDKDKTNNDKYQAIIMVLSWPSCTCTEERGR